MSAAHEAIKILKLKWETLLVSHQKKQFLTKTIPLLASDILKTANEIEVEANQLELRWQSDHLSEGANSMSSVEQPQQGFLLAVE